VAGRNRRHSPTPATKTCRWGPRLDDDKQRPAKQRHTAKRIFERLKAEHGFTGGYTIVKDYVRSAELHRREMFIPLTHAPGEAQADFGEALVVVAGVEQKAHYLAMDLPHSDDCFVAAFPAETTEAFIEGHVRAFAYFGAVPARILYDNTKIAVARILGGEERQRARAFTAHGDASYRDESSVVFGMRKLGIKGTRFTLNGRPLLLRGTLECAIFPLTGYPPTDVDSWRRIYQIEKSYGLNYIRFHSWAPPEAAFTAVDIEGIFIQTEGPQANVPTGEVKQRDQFVERELLRIVDTYGNHPSFALMTIGNEFGGSLPVVTRWVDLLIKADNRHFYSSASSNPMKSANRQFTEDKAMRGVHGPGTTFGYDELMAKEDRPFIGHEIGQWTFFPNLDEIPKYTGVLKARNFEIVRDDLTRKGMREEAQLFLQATGKQAILLYKDEIESIIRTRGYAGFSLLDLHDYPGQGTALIGLLDSFWDSKGLIAPSEHKCYAGPVVPLLRFEKRTYSSEETFHGTVDLSNFGPANLNRVAPAWSIADESGAVVVSGSLTPTNAPTGSLTQLGSFTAPLSKAVDASKLKVDVFIPGTTISNSWEIWVYPSKDDAQAPSDVIVVHDWGNKAKEALALGKRVIVFPSSQPPRSVLKGSFKPVFWSPIWFKRGPSTMGILVNPDHPLFSLFPTDCYSNWPWNSMIEGSQSVILDDTPLAYRPLVQVIDNFARNHRLGSVFEASVTRGRLLICTLNLGQNDKATQTIEQRQFLSSLYAYVSSQMFAPKQEMTLDVLDKILALP
jgi:hypothetical protein